MRLLLTGFEPFGGESINPSREVVQAIAAAPPRDLEIEALILPVRAGISFEWLVPAFEAGACDAWLGLGQAEGRAQLSVERLGVNLRIDRDAAGDALEEEPVVEGAPAAYFARMPVVRITAAIRAAGVPAEASNSAGLYVCNEALFAMLHHLSCREAAAPGGFVHLPYLPEQTRGKPAGTPSLSLERQICGVRAAIESVRDLLSNGLTT